MNQYKCHKCLGVFDDSQKDQEDDNRCPLCKIAFSQMPYEAPHEISDYSLEDTKIQQNKINMIKQHEMTKERWCKNCGMIAEDLGFDEGCKKDISPNDGYKDHRWNTSSTPKEDTGTFADHLEEIDRD